jgi:hypothetical protein
MLSALQQRVKGNIAGKAIAAIIADRRERVRVPPEESKKVLRCKALSHVYASFRVLTLEARDAGQRVIQ